MASRSSLAFAPAARASASALRSAPVSPLANARSARRKAGRRRRGGSSRAPSRAARRTRRSGRPRARALRRCARRSSFRSGRRFSEARTSSAIAALPVVPRERAIEVHLGVGIELLDPSGDLVGLLRGPLLIERLQIEAERVHVVGKARARRSARARIALRPASSRLGVDPRELLVKLGLVRVPRGELAHRLDRLDEPLLLPRRRRMSHACEYQSRRVAP